MELVNGTRLEAGTMVASDARGRERIVAVVKGTFDLSAGEGEPQLAEEQSPIVEADTFTGDPGASSTIYESDLVPFKPRCDVLLHGSAYAPGGKPAKRVRVALNIGRMLKGFDVIGDRVWTKPTLGFKLASDPVPFIQQRISYERAFGGMDVHPKEPGKITHYESNPIGVGYYPFSKAKHLEGRLLPITAEIDSKADSPKGRYQPMGFGPIGRNFQPRTRFAGTYDEQWMDEGFPFLPEDFDPSFFQSAPLDQQIPYPKGGEMVVLRNLTPKGRAALRIPRLEVPVEFNCRKARRTTTNAVIDTIIIEPDEKRLLVIWRASLFLRRSIHEVRQIVVGHMPQPWYRARDAAEVEPPPFPIVEKIEEPPSAEPVTPEEPLPAAVEADVEPRPAIETPLAPPAEPAVMVIAPQAVEAEPAPSDEPPSPAMVQMSKTQVLSGEGADEVSAALRDEQVDDEEEEDLTATHTWERLVATQDLPELAALLDDGDDEEEEDLTGTLSWEVSPWDSGPPIPDDLLDDDEEDPTLYLALDSSTAEPAEPRESSESEEEFTATMMSMPTDVSKMLREALSAREQKDEEERAEPTWVASNEDEQEAESPPSSSVEDETAQMMPGGDSPTTREIDEGITDTVVEVPEAVKALLESIDEPKEDDDDPTVTSMKPSGSSEDEEK